jgi:hypothetical protein
MLTTLKGDITKPFAPQSALDLKAPLASHQLYRNGRESIKQWLDCHCQMLILLAMRTNQFLLLSNSFRFKSKFNSPLSQERFQESKRWWIIKCRHTSDANKTSFNSNHKRIKSEFSFTQLLQERFQEWTSTMVGLEM